MWLEYNGVRVVQLSRTSVMIRALRPTAQFIALDIFKPDFIAAAATTHGRGIQDQAAA